LRRPRVGCVLACGSYLVGTPLAMLGKPFLYLLASGLLVVMVAAYRPLRVYVHDLDHDRVLGRDYKQGDRQISTGEKLHEYEERLVKRAVDPTRWVVGGLAAFGVWYAMLALWLGLWLPHTTGQLGWLMGGIVATTLGLPTVIMAWIYKDDFDLPWSALEDDE
jgi:hypothetical protein